MYNHIAEISIIEIIINLLEGRNEEEITPTQMLLKIINHKQIEDYIKPEVLTHYIRRKNTRSIYIENEDLSPPRLSILCKGIKNSKIVKELGIRECIVEKGVGGHIGKLMEGNIYIENIYIEGQELSTQDIQNLCAPLLTFPSPKLRKLRLENNSLGNFGVIYLGNVLKTNNSLEELRIYESDVTVAGRKVLLDGLRDNHTLYILDFGDYGEEEGEMIGKEIQNIIQRNKSLRVEKYRGRARKSTPNMLYFLTPIQSSQSIFEGVGVQVNREHSFVCLTNREDKSIRPVWECSLCGFTYGEEEEEMLINKFCMETRNRVLLVKELEEQREICMVKLAMLRKYYMNIIDNDA